MGDKRVKMELTPSVIYRWKARSRITAGDYDEAIQALREAKQQLKPDGDNCRVCGDSGHQAWECHHNPLVMAREAACAREQWRCFHCGEVFTDAKLVEDHFGPPESPRPAECQQAVSDRAMLDAIIIEFERRVHRNHHNAADVKILVEMTTISALKWARKHGPEAISAELRRLGRR